jgi:hypothetical protein
MDVHTSILFILSLPCKAQAKSIKLADKCAQLEKITLFMSFLFG